MRVSYPRNLVPVLQDSGLAEGFLRPAEGIVSFGTGPGPDRGGINWNGRYIRVMGPKLIEISKFGVVTEIGEVEGSVDPVTLDYSFDYLACASNGKLWLYDGGTLTQVTDVDLGTCIDVVWVDGYFISTDGEFLVVGDLNDPFDINQLKYASSEVDPDPIEALLKLRNEVYVLNRYTIEVFRNVGGTGFPFQRINGGQMRRGVIGTHACCVFTDEFIAFVGGGRNESPAVWIGANGQTKKVSSREIDKVLATYGEEVLKDVILEERIDQNHKFLVLHLPDRTFVYDFAASETGQTQIWHELSSSELGSGIYRGRNFVYVFDAWHCGDPTAGNAFGYLDSTISTHYGEKTGWEFSTKIVHAEGNGLIFHEVELNGTPGRGVVNQNAKISTEYSLDHGMTWSQPKYISPGRLGQRNKHVSWLRQGFMRNQRSQRFRGDSDTHMSFNRLDLRVEKLHYG